MGSSPLQWPSTWTRMNRWQRFLLWFPVIGPQHRVFKDIRTQLEGRTEIDNGNWDGYPSPIRAGSKRVAEILKEYLDWPNARFRPDDPCDIFFWDRTGDLRSAEAILAVENHFGVEMNEQYWSDLSRKPFARLIGDLLDRKAEQIDDGNSVKPPGNERTP